MKKVTGMILAMAGIVMVIAGVVIKVRKETTAVIGGADGPTAIFLAGKIGNGSMLAGAGVAAVLVIAGIVLIRKKK